MAINAGAFETIGMAASAANITPLAAHTGTGVKFEFFPGFPCTVTGFGYLCCVAPASAVIVALQRRPVAGVAGSEVSLGTITVPTTAIAGSVWLNEAFASAIASGIITPYINWGESLVFNVTQISSGSTATWLPILGVSPFRSGTAATGTGVAKKVVVSGATGTINHVVA